MAADRPAEGSRALQTVALGHRPAGRGGPRKAVRPGRVGGAHREGVRRRRSRRRRRARRSLRTGDNGHSRLVGTRPARAHVDEPRVFSRSTSRPPWTCRRTQPSKSPSAHATASATSCAWSCRGAGVSTAARSWPSSSMPASSSRRPGTPGHVRAARPPRTTSSSTKRRGPTSKCRPRRPESDP